ncbi:uncharacterized protein LOC142489480 [Ascaphus truei]|uniref:uncharacterized protein LOC142489480 n=1 Tax=Ascaphus truei TaxID=8439 RepID=UPI003F59FB33
MDMEELEETDTPNITSDYVSNYLDNTQRSKKAKRMFENLPNPDCEDSSDLHDLFLKFSKLLITDTRIYWDLIFLENYLLLKRIPRGLRVKKSPTFGFINQDFEREWKMILNDCSSKLISLIVKAKSKEKLDLEKEIKLSQKHLAKFSKMEGFRALDINLAKSVKDFEKDILEKKQQKFERDKLDYERNQVYLWERSTPNRRSSRTTHPTHSTPEDKINNPWAKKSILKSKADSDTSDTEYLGHTVSFFNAQEEENLQSEAEAPKEQRPFWERKQRDRSSEYKSRPSTSSEPTNYTTASKNSKEQDGARKPKTQYKGAPSKRKKNF